MRGSPLGGAARHIRSIPSKSVLAQRDVPIQLFRGRQTVDNPLADLSRKSYTIEPDFELRKLSMVTRGPCQQAGAILGFDMRRARKRYCTDWSCQSTRNLWIHSSAGRTRSARTSAIVLDRFFALFGCVEVGSAERIHLQGRVASDEKCRSSPQAIQRTESILEKSIYC